MTQGTVKILDLHNKHIGDQKKNKNKLRGEIKLVQISYFVIIPYRRET